MITVEEFEELPEEQQWVKIAEAVNEISDLVGELKSIVRS